MSEVPLSLVPGFGMLVALANLMKGGGDYALLPMVMVLSQCFSDHFICVDIGCTLP